jgi:hypothetical protein
MQKKVDCLVYFFQGDAFADSGDLSTNAFQSFESQKTLQSSNLDDHILKLLLNCLKLQFLQKNSNYY